MTRQDAVQRRFFAATRRAWSGRTSAQLQIERRQVDRRLHPLKVRPLHAVGGVDAGADEGTPGVDARVPGHGDVGGVVGVDVHRVGDGVGPGQLHQAGDHTVVVGAAVVLGADGHLALGAAQVVPHAAHVHRQQLVHLGQ